jgi:hypothetical protein
MAVCPACASSELHKHARLCAIETGASLLMGNMGSRWRWVATLPLPVQRADNRGFGLLVGGGLLGQGIICKVFVVGGGVWGVCWLLYRLDNGRYMLLSCVASTHATWQVVAPVTSVVAQSLEVLWSVRGVWSLSVSSIEKASTVLFFVLW